MHTVLNRMVSRVLYFTLSLFFVGVSAQLAADELADIVKRIKPVGQVCIQGQNCTAGSGDVAVIPAAPELAPAPAPVPEVAVAVEQTTTAVTETVVAVKEMAAPVAAAKLMAEYTGRSGAEIYGKACFMCHASGMAGAPKVGDAAAWAPRAAMGMDAMMKNAIDGLNAMPPRGTCGNCSDDELRVVIQYMLDQSK